MIELMIIGLNVAAAAPFRQRFCRQGF